MSTKTTKSIRMSDEAKRLVRLLAAYEDKTEGQIIEEALPLYLQMRALSYGNELPAARQLANSTPDTAGEIVEKLTAAIEAAIGNGLTAPAPGSGKERLRAKARSRAKAAG